MKKPETKPAKNPYVFDPKREPRRGFVKPYSSRFLACEYCGALDEPRPEPKSPGDFYCPNCKGAR